MADRVLPSREEMAEADEALKRLSAHRCSTSDGASIVCLCVRGVDHDEDDFDVPLVV